MFKLLPPMRAYTHHYTHARACVHRTVEKLRNDYGDLCYVRVGPYPCVIVSGARMIRKMFVDNKEMFSNRANVSRVDRYIGVGKG